MSKTRRKSYKRSLYAVARLIHVYLSMLLLCLLFLFCLTGITLNHSDWFSGDSSDGVIKDSLPTGLSEKVLDSSVFSDPPLKELQRFLHDKYNLKKVSDISLDEDMSEIILDYKIPAGYAAAIVNTHNATLSVDYRIGSFWLLINDLHKGRNSGKAWSWVIDISAGLMILFSLAGLVILFQNNKYRKLGLVLTGLGIFSPVCIYWFLVPRLIGF